MILQKEIFTLCFLVSLNSIHGQDTTIISDPNFEKALLDLGIDSDGTVNGQVFTADIDQVTKLNVINYHISSLSGIEDFVSLQQLNCSNNTLTVIDITQNLKLSDFNCASNVLSQLSTNTNMNLENLNCRDNQLTNLDISLNTFLRNVDFSSNQISRIDLSRNDSLKSLRASNNELDSLSLSGNTLLEEINISNNRLTFLDISGNAYLRNVLLGSNQLLELDVNGNDSLSYLDASDNQLTQLEVRQNPLLTNLVCSKNQLTTIDLSNNDSLTFLSASNNKLKSIDLSNNKKLETFIAASNQLTHLNIDSNLFLQKIDVSRNLITDLNFTSNDSLTSITVSENELRSLNIQNGSNSEITTFDATGNDDLLCIQIDDTSVVYDDWEKDSIARYNEICEPLTHVPDENFEKALIDMGYDRGPPDNYVPTAAIDTIKSLDLSGKQIENLTGLNNFAALTSLDCSGNFLANLDVTALNQISNLNCSGNQLTDLVIGSSQNHLGTLDATNNPLLTCIVVDNVPGANNAANWSKDATASYNLSCIANKTYIPDHNFEQALIDLGYDKGTPDGYVVTDSINGIAKLDVSQRKINDLTGIEAFASLDSLDCSSNRLSSLNVSSLTSLKKLVCFSNYLQALDVTSNSDLVELNCGDNDLTNVDVSGNKALRVLVCDANYLKALDVSQNTELQSLNCGSNLLRGATLNVTKNVKLTRFLFPGNKLTAIDLSKNILLTEIDCAANFLTSLDISKNPALIRVNCSQNSLSILDVAVNINLQDLECNTNQLTALSLRPNTKLKNMSANNNLLNDLDVTNNALLAGLSVNSNNLATINAGGNPKLNVLQCDDNSLSDLDLATNDSLKYLSLARNKVSSLSTANLIELEYLNCDGNNISALDLKTNVSLAEMHSPRNNLADLDLQNNLLLQVVDISDNKLTGLNVSKQAALQTLTCSDNQIVQLDFDVNSGLRSLTCTNNKLARLSIRNGHNDSLETFNATNNPDLLCIEVDDPATVHTDWQKDSTAFYSKNCHYDETYIPDDNFESAIASITGLPDDNDDYVLTAAIDTLTALNVSNKSIADLTGIAAIESLETLNASNNVLGSISLDSNTRLVNLDVSHNLLASLDVAAHRQLQSLDISYNTITAINTDSLISLKTFITDSNVLTILDVRSNYELISLHSASNQLNILRANNGHNNILKTFDARNNPGLTCIQVDDPALASAAGWQKDNIASYSTNCHYNETYVPDDAFEQALIDQGFDYPGTDTLDDYVPNAKIITATALDLSDKNIQDASGLQAFASLTSLNIKGNQLTALDLGGSKMLRTLNCSANFLSKLVLTDNSSLEVLNCSDNALASLDLANNTILSSMIIDKNPLDKLNVGSNVSLEYLHASRTELLTLDLSQNNNLEELLATHNDKLLAVNIRNGNNGQINKLDLTSNPLLNCILVDNLDSAKSYQNWQKDATAAYRLICDDDDNDGVPNNEDQCPATTPGDKVDLFGCSVLILPANNFTISVFGETCRNNNDGSIIITALQAYAYRINLKIDGDSTQYNFTNSIEIKNLHAGTYRLCITIQDKPGFQNCYEVVITEPIDLSVIPRANPQNGDVMLELAGGKNYTIKLNGQEYRTNESSITLSLAEGVNKVSVATDAACQGLFETTLYNGETLFYFPNPVKDQLHIFLGADRSSIAKVEIYSTTGQLSYSKLLPVNGGQVLLNDIKLAPGIYAVSVRTPDKPYIFKIVKQ